MSTSSLSRQSTRSINPRQDATMVPVAVASAVVAAGVSYLVRSSTQRRRQENNKKDNHKDEVTVEKNADGEVSNEDNVPVSPTEDVTTPPSPPPVQEVALEKKDDNNNNNNNNNTMTSSPSDPDKSFDTTLTVASTESEGFSINAEDNDSEKDAQEEASIPNQFVESENGEESSKQTFYSAKTKTDLDVQDEEVKAVSDDAGVAPVDESLPADDPACEDPVTEGIQKDETIASSLSNEESPSSEVESAVNATVADVSVVPSTPAKEAYSAPVKEVITKPMKEVTTKPMKEVVITKPMKDEVMNRKEKATSSGSTQTKARRRRIKVKDNLITRKSSYDKDEEVMA